MSLSYRFASRGFLCATALILAGCGANRYCAKPQAYESAPSVPVIRSIDNIRVEPSPDAYLIPAEPADPVPFGQKVAVAGKPGRTEWSCLDQPTALPPLGSAATSAPAKP